MKIVSLITTCLFLTCSSEAFTQYNHENLRIQRTADFSDNSDYKPAQFETKFTHDNLRLYPIVASDAFMAAHEDLGKFTLLKDAIEDDKLVITETGATQLANLDASEHSITDGAPDGEVITRIEAANVTLSDQPITNTIYAQDSIDDSGRAAANALPATNNAVNNLDTNSWAAVQSNLDSIMGLDSTTLLQLDQILSQQLYMFDGRDEAPDYSQVTYTPDFGDINLMVNDRSVSGTVNTLFAQNNSQDTIFIMAGEVVKGGKQDRVIAEDLVIAPDEKINLSAFCVEKSRWSTRDGNSGSFDGYYNFSSMDIRKVVTEDADQSEVWNTVADHTITNNADSDTKAYTNLENSEEYQEKVMGYLNEFKDVFKADSNVIGVIAVTGDEIIGMDLFATHDLFADSYDNLIHSYIGHAITNGSKVTIKNKEVFAYLDNILKDEEGQDEEIEKNGTVYKYQDKKLHLTSYK